MRELWARTQAVLALDRRRLTVLWAALVRDHRTFEAVSPDSVAAAA